MNSFSKITIAFCFLLMLFLQNVVLGQDTWIRKSDFAGSGRKGAVACTIGDKSYIGMGFDGIYHKDFWEYDPAIDSWIQLTDMPGQARAYAACFALGNKIYITTGYNGGFLLDTWVYNTTNHTWSAGINFPGGARQGCISTVIGDKAYVGLGYDGAYRKDFYEFDPVSNSWTARNNFGGQGRIYASAFSIGTKAYVGLGYNGSYLSDFYVYDRVSNTWSPINALSHGRSGAVGFALNQKGYIALGDDGTNLLNDLWEYDVNANLWSRKSDFPALPRENSVSFAYSDAAYISCGGDNATGYFRDLWKWQDDHCTLSVTATKKNVSCFGEADGSIHLTTTGGIEPLIFTWNSGDNTSHISGLLPNTYQVTVRDEENCKLIKRFTITQPPALIFGKDTSQWFLPRKGGGAAHDEGRCIVADEAGNIFLAGTFGGNAVFGSTSLTSTGGKDIFLAKYNHLGNLQWIQQIGGSLDDEVTGIGLDSIGNIFLSGSFRVMALFGGNQYFAQGESDAFLAKYSPTGILKWVQTGGGNFEDKALALYVVSDGSCFVTGYFQGNADFQGHNLISSGGEDVFIARYNGAGVLDWIQQGGGLSPDRGHAVIYTIADEVVVTGIFQGNATFGNSSVTSAGDNDIFIARYDRYGNLLSLQSSGGIADDQPFGLDADEQNNIFISGYFGATATFGGVNLTCAGSKDVFVVKLNPSGNAIFAKRAGGSGEDIAYGLVYTPSGQIYITGKFSGSSQWDSFDLVSSGGSDIFICRLDSAGVFRMVKSTGNIGDDVSYDLTLDKQYNPIFIGNFTNSLLLAGTTLISSGQSDMIFAGLKESTFYRAPTIIPVTCESGNDGSIEVYIAGGTPDYTFQWSNGATTQNINEIPEGDYSLSISDTKGCTKDTSFVVSSQFTLPQAPVSAIVNRQGFCADDPGNITLTAIGGSGNNLVWFTGECGGDSIGTGTSITIPSPDTTTVYFARWENPCGVTTCANIVVNVLPLPTPPNSIQIIPSTACEGAGSVILTATGGSGEVFRWYEGSCNGPLIATGNPAVIPAPSVSTTYFGRWETTCGVSICLSGSVTVLALAKPVTAVTTDTNHLCYNYPGNIRLTAFGGSGDVLKWGLSCHGTPINQGNPVILDAPNITTTYYVWWENSCGPSVCDSITIFVSEPPVAPTGILLSDSAYCYGSINSLTLIAIGGSGEEVIWFKDYCGSQQVVGMGNPLTIPAPYVNTVYYARWETACGFSACIGTYVTVYPVPEVSFTGLSNIYCENDAPDTLWGNHMPYGTFWGPGITDNGDGTAIFNPAAAGAGGTYTITYSYTDINGCFDDDIQFVTVRALPYVNYAGLDPSYCVNASPATLVGNMAPYGVFNGPGIMASNNGVGTFNPSIAGAGGPYPITYSYTDIYGCSNSIIKTTSVTALPTLSFTGLQSAYCLNAGPTTLTGNYAPDGFFTGAGIINIGFGQAIFDPGIAGIGGPYVITYTYTDPNGCTNSVSQPTTVYSLPEVNFTGLLATYCSNDEPVLLIGNMAPQGTFSGPGITSNPNGTATFNPSIAGSGLHTITYSFTDPNGCTNTYSQKTTVLPAPAVDFSGLDPNHCLNSPIALLTGNFAPFGSFLGPGITDNLNGTAIFSAATAGAGGPYNITYTYQALNGCINHMTKQTTVNALPVVSFSGLVTSYCLNSTPATLTGNQAPQGHFEGPGITDYGNGTAMFNPALAGVGIHSIYYYFTDGNFCTDTMFKEVIVNALPQPSITNILSQYCVNASPDTITGNFYPLGSFSGPGIIDLNIGKAIFDPDAAGVGGPYDIIYSYTDFNGCTGDTTYQITVLPKPSVDFNPFSASYCIDDVPVLLSGNHLPYGSFSGPGIFDQGNGTAIFDPLAAGPGFKQVNYIFTDNNGCYNDTTKTTKVIPFPEKPIAVTSTLNNFCTGWVTQINLGVIGGNGDTVEVYTENCGGVLAGMFEPPSLLTVTAPTDTTTYYARWVNACGNSECDSIVINVIPFPLPPDSLGVDTNNYCAGTVNIITLSAGGGIGSTLKWWKDSCGGTLVGIGQPLIITAPNDTTTYWATYENQCGISTCDSLQINVTPQPLSPSALQVDTNFFCTGTINQINLTATGGAGDTLYWFKDECGGNPIGYGTPLTISAPDSSAIYHARWGNKCNLSNCLSIEVEVLQPPVRPFSLSTNENDFCAEEVGVIQLSASGGSGDTLQWFKGNCGGIYIGTGSPLLISAPGDTTIYYSRWTNLCGQSECDSIIINVRPQPRPLDSLSVDTNYFCISYNENIQLSAYGIYEYGDTVRWYEGGCGQNFIGSGNSLTIAAPDVSTTYYANNNNSCGESICRSIQVIVNTPEPPVLLTANPLFKCVSDTGQVTLKSFGGNGEIISWYADSCGGVPIGHGDSITISYPDTTTFFYARWENYCGESPCVSIPVNVVEIPSPPAQILSDTNYYCIGDVDYITLTAFGGYGDTLSPWGETLRWFVKSCGGATIGTRKNITIPAPVASTWFFARWENACGVSICDSFNLIVYTPRPPDSVIADTNYFCPGTVDSVSLMAWGGVGDQILWAKIYGNDTIAAGSTNPFRVAAPNTTTRYLVRMKNYCGISKWFPFDIVVNLPQPPKLIVSDLDSLVCSNYPGYIHLWTIGGWGDTVKWYSTDASGQNPVFLYSGDTLSLSPPTGTSYLMATFVTACGESKGTKTHIRTVPAPIVNIISNDSICEGSRYHVMGDLISNFHHLKWTVDGIGNLDHPTQKSPVYSYGNHDIINPTVVYLKVNVFGNYPCGMVKDSLKLTINPKPELVLTPPSPALCRDSVLILSASGSETFKWTPNQDIDTTYGSLVKISPKHDMDYSLIGMNHSGCRDTLTIHVTVKPAPYLNLGEDLYLFSCDPIILDAGGGDGSDFYEWQDGSTKRTLKVYGNGTYWVRVFNEGCAVVDTIKVQLCEGFIYVPYAFTPNNDGLNDMFKVITTDPTIHFHIYIYNRHGQLVFQTDDIEKGWDGKIDGEMAPADVYVYLIEYRDNGTHSPGVTKTLKGSFILVR